MKFKDSQNIEHNDIVLIRLKSDIRFSTKVQLITLPKNNSIKFDGALTTIIGMGHTSTSLKVRVINLIQTFLNYYLST